MERLSPPPHARPVQGRVLQEDAEDRGAGSLDVLDEEVRDDKEPYIQAYLRLAEAGYDIAPCGSNCYGVTENFPDMAEYCKEKIPAAQFKGMIMAPWIKTIPEYRRLHWQAADLMAEAIKRVG